MDTQAQSRAPQVRQAEPRAAGGEASPLRWLAALLAAPLFLRLGGPSWIGLPETSSSRVGGQTLPWSLFLCAGLSLGLLWRRIKDPPERRVDRAFLDYPVVAFALLCLTSFAVVALRRFTPVAVLYLAQTLLPILGFYLALHWIRSERDLREALRTFVLTGVLVALCLLSYSIGSKGPLEVATHPFPTSFWGLWNIYQSNDYFPFVLALTFLWCAALETELGFFRGLGYLFLYPMGIVLMALYARGSVLTALGGCLLALAFGRGARHKRLKLILVLTSLFAIGEGLNVFVFDRLRDNLRTFLATHSFSQTIRRDGSLKDRHFHQRNAVEFLKKAPLSGLGFNPAALGHSSDRIVSPHNQYLDLAQKGGPLLAAFFFLLLALAALRSYQLIHQARSELLRAVGVGLLATQGITWLFANFYQSNYTQPFSGLFLWFLMGMTEAALRINGQGSGGTETGKTACFFAWVDDSKLLQVVDFYRNDIRILKELGYKVRVASNYRELPMDCDLYFTWWWGGGALTLPVSMIRGKPNIFVGAHHYHEADGAFHGASPSLKKLLKRAAIRASLRLASANLFMSRQEYRIVEHLPVRNPRLVYLSVDTDLYVPAPEAEKGFLLTITHLTAYNVRRKMVLETLEAFAYILKKHPGERLCIIGEHREGYPEARALAERLGILDRVHFAGRIGLEDGKIDYLQRAKIYLQPTRYEGFGLAVAEAMACGLPVVTTPIPTVQEVLGDAGLYAQEPSAQGIARACLQLLDDPALAARKGMEARERVLELFSHRKRRETIAEVISELRAA